MKLVKNLVFAGLLVFTITFNTFAGDQQIPAVAPPQPTPPADRMVVYHDGPISPSIDPYTGEITAETTDYLFFEALAALLSVY